MTSFKNILIAAAALLAVPTIATAQATSVVMNNQSSFTIYSMYLSPTASDDWGPDQLGEDVVEPGATLTLSGISCGTYDVRLTNPAGETCTISGYDICSGSETWTLTTSNLMACGG